MAPSADEDGGGVGRARAMRKTSVTEAATIARRRTKAGLPPGTLRLSASAASDLCAGVRRGRAGRARGPGGYFLPAILAVAKLLMMTASESGWSFITQ